MCQPAPKRAPLLLDPFRTTLLLFWKWNVLLITPLSRWSIRGLMRMATKFWRFMNHITIRMCSMTWTFGCVFVNMTKLMLRYPLLRCYLENRSNKLRKIYRLLNLHHLKPALREVPIQVILEFPLLECCFCFFFCYFILFYFIFLVEGFGLVPPLVIIFPFF